MTNNRLLTAVGVIAVSQVIIMINLFMMKPPKLELVCRGMNTNPNNIECFQQ